MARSAYHSPAWPALRLRVLARDGYRCHWCSGPANEADHVVALAEGGAALDLANLVASCKRCNMQRGRHVRSRGARIGRRSRRW
jgi:5-methylcytosine-specific restriction endonuclease McrA